MAAEQGVIGIAAYLTLLAAALWTVFSGMRSIAPGMGLPSIPWRRGTGWSSRRPGSGIAAAFIALLVHTIGYAAYLTDPLTRRYAGRGRARGRAQGRESGRGGPPRGLNPPLLLQSRLRR